MCLKYIDIAINLNHGKGHLHVSDNFIACYNYDNDNKWSKKSCTCALGNTHCRKDNSEIIKHMLEQYLNNDISYIQQCGVAVDGKDEV